MLTLNQFLFRYGIQIIITPLDGSNYMSATLRDAKDELAVTPDCEAVYGKFEDLPDKLVEMLSGKNLYLSDESSIYVPELRI